MNTAMRSILLLCVLWLSGCDSLYTINPIADGNTPVDKRLIGAWVHVDPDEFGVLSIEKKDKNTNELAVILLQKNEYCGVVEGRAIQLSDYWIFESDVDRDSYSCVAPHGNPESGEVKDKDTLKELGNRYQHLAYKILEWNDPNIAKIIEQVEYLNDESISEAIKDTIKYYKLGETPSVLIASTLRPKRFAKQIKAGKMKGSIKGERKDDSTIIEILDVTVTDSPEVVRAYLSDLDFFEDMDGAALFIRISEDKD
jgi:hypothetical protein